MERSLTAAESRAVDQRAIERYGLSSLVLMENAGRGCVDVMETRGIRGRVIICCGKGNNGGDGFVIARHLELRGYATSVWLWCDPEELRGDAATNYDVLVRSGSPPRHCSAADAPRLADELATADWIVDALLGTGARGAPREPFATCLRLLNAAPGNKLAVDLPSGLDADSGDPADPTFHADLTCTFVARKRGFAAPQAAPFLGEVRVCDIGLDPRKLIG